MPPTPSDDDGRRALDHLRRAGDGFTAVVATVAPSQWSDPTPCDDWTVRQVVGHVVAGSAMAAALVNSATRDQAIARLGVDELGDDPPDAVRRFLADQLAAFAALDSFDRPCAHPAGPMTAGELMALRTTDLLVHTWDLASALGTDAVLDADVVAHVWDALAPMAPYIGRLGVFGDGPSANLPPDAPLQDRLLDLTGRRPRPALSH